MFFILGILVGIGISIIVFMASAQHSKAINDRLMGNTDLPTEIEEKPVQMAQIIHKQTAVQKFLNQDE